jgi:hypothetical protein
MSAEKIWVPFGNPGKEENPFHFDPARQALRNAIQLAWMSTPEWGNSPLRLENVGLMERHLRTTLDDLLREVREDADRQRREDAR